MVCFMLFCFKRKTAYEMRISDWSSDVFSSDLLEVVFNEVVDAAAGAFALACDVSGGVALSHPASGAAFTLSTNIALHGGEHCVLSIDAAKPIGRAPCRESVCPSGTISVVAVS